MMIVQMAHSRPLRRAIQALAILVLAVAAYAFAETLTRRWTVGWQSEQIVNIQPPKDGEVSLAIVGDVMLGRGVEEAVNREAGGDFKYPFRHVRSYLREADLAVGNLESPISDRGAPIDKKYVFRVPSEAADGLVDAGFDVLSVANNHILDYGLIAAEDTGRLLADAGIQWGGLVPEGGRQEPVILPVRGVRVGFLFYCDLDPDSCAKQFLQFPLRPPYATEETLTRDIDELESKADIVVVSIHWGIEDALRPEQRTVSLARMIIDRGADILIGHHPHAQQDVEFYKDGVIFYSVGNFVFEQGITPTTRRISRLYRVIARRDGVRSIVLFPLEIRPRTWDAFPLSDGYVELSADSFRRRSELPGSRPWWRIWVPKFWTRDYWSSGGLAESLRAKRLTHPGCFLTRRSPPPCALSQRKAGRLTYGV
jgi:poly-gamma-glutamate capsule biosynthesis protein CapA/YwtB (metallophosphatase superfamily)